METLFIPCSCAPCTVFDDVAELCLDLWFDELDSG